MENSYKLYMTTRSESELENYILHPDNFNPEAISAAIDELAARGRVFKEGELNAVKAIIDEKLAKKAQAEKEELEKIFAEDSYYQKLEAAFDKENLPAYYSNRAVYFFSIFFSVIFGAVLLAVNIWDNKTARWNVIGFGVLYSVAAVSLLSLLGVNSVWSVVINAIGGAILAGYFWNKYIGSTVDYVKKPIWKPLVISLLICIPFVVATLYTLKMGEV